MESVDLRKLTDYSNSQEFIYELLNAETNLELSQSKDFFKIVVSHFSERVPKKVGTAILTTLSHILTDKKHMEKFSKSSFVLRLPYHQKNLTDPLFDLLFIIFTHCPELVSDSVANKFAPLITRNPRKALMIIVQYSQYFDELENPFPLIDMLINGEEYFVNSDCCCDYIQSLTFLCSEFHVFRNGRYKDCAEIAKRCLDSEDIDVVKCSYDCLATISEKKEDVEVPSKKIMEHINTKELQESIINYLMVAQTFQCTNIKFIKKLIRIAQDNVNATLVLMKMAVNDDFADILVEYSKWMAADLPTPVDTLRLFLVVFQKKSLRNAISRLPEFIQVLRSIVDMKKVEFLPVVCTIIRRVRLNEKLIKRMSEEKLIGAFLQTADEMETPEAMYASILFVKTVSDVCFVREFTTFCEALAESAAENDENFLKIVALSLDLCKYKKCLNRLRQCRMSKILKKSGKENKSKVKELISVLDNEDDSSED